MINSFDTTNPLSYIRVMRRLLILLGLLIPFSAWALDEQAQEYRHCLAQIKVNADDALEEAMAWATMGGGEPARHCSALARIGQKQYEDGAKRLEELALSSRQEAIIRASMLAQAANAWLLADEWDRADADQRAALTLSPNNPDILLDRAVTLGEVHHYQEAIDTLSRVLTLQPNRVEALVLRASARRFLDDRKAALSDVEKALSLDPTDNDGLLERGILRRLNGDNKGAREDWLTIVTNAPTSSAAPTAQRNLELLDMGAH
jgi:regulator of sirC expression with transglutaminase-like and TPR domain